MYLTEYRKNLLRKENNRVALILLVLFLLSGLTI